MSKQSLKADIVASDDFINTAKSESLGYGQVFDLIGAEIAFTQAMIVTTLPRGTLQIAQPSRLPEELLKSYGRELHLFDRLTWCAIERQSTVRGPECLAGGDFESSRYYKEFMAAHQFRHVAVAPLQSPVFQGYPGALHLYRSAEQGPFKNDQLSAINVIAGKLDQAILLTRSARKSRRAVETEDRKHTGNLRSFIFNGKGQPLPVGADPKSLDDSLHRQMMQIVRKRLEQLNGEAMTGDRVSLADEHGEHWLFQVVTHRSYSALGEGAFVFFCQQPAVSDWSALRATDFQADNELARLIPAVHFMEAEFHRGPKLDEIAKQVHLSQFHFHRRFTELLGITPKHFLLDCQIDQAKKQLLAGDVDLADIASGCGFAHQSHFTSRFKQATGLTPTRWRRFANQIVRASQN